MSEMTPNDLLKKVRKIEIKTKALSHQIFAGEYHSAFKGRGMAFSEVREYQYGDDVRNMDWNVTARMSAPYVKVFEEERELTVVLLVDISRSGLFGTARKTKREQIAEIAAVLAFSAILNNDKVGALLFSDRVEKFIPPKKGRSHLLHIIREILDYEPQSTGTDISEALRFLTGAVKKKCTAFILSDMLDVREDGMPRYEDALKVAVNRHDLSVIQVYDPRERTLPDVGLVHVKDAESGEAAWIDTGSRKVRSAYGEWFRKAGAEAEKLFNAGDLDGLRNLACENGIPDDFTEMYIEGEIEQLCDDQVAAVGKIDMEIDEMKPIEILVDWADYIKAQCMEDDLFCRQVRRRGKSLEGCIAEIAIWSLIHAQPLSDKIIKAMEKAGKEHEKELKAAGIEQRWIRYTKTGAPGSARTRQIIREYYMGGK